MNLRRFNKLVAMVAAVNLLYPSAQAEPYDPILPRTVETERLLVLDFGISKEKLGIGRGRDAVYTLTCLQGLANRGSSVKVAFDNMPVRIFWRPEYPDQGSGNASAPGEGNPFDLMIEDGIFPYEIERISVSENEKYPVLKWMLDNYGNLIRGTVLVPSSGENALSAQTAAINSCTFEDLLPVTLEIDEWMRSKGYTYSRVFDLTKGGSIPIQRWSANRYADRPDVCKTVVAFGANPAVMNDYWVIGKVFAYYINLREHPEQEILYDIVLKDKKGHWRWPQGVVHIGDSEWPHVIPGLQERGYTAINGFIPNVSVTSSSRIDSGVFQKAPEPTVHPVSGNPIYLSFHGNDGDAIDFGNYIAYKALYNDPKAGNIPMSFKVNPYFMDLNPLLVLAISKKHRDSMDMTIAMNDGGASNTDEGKEYWFEQLRHFLDGSNGSFQTMNYFGAYGTASDIAEKLETLPGMLYVYRAYQAGSNQASKFRVSENGYTVFSSMVGMAGWTPAQLAEDLKHRIKNHGPSGPQFYLGRLGVKGENQVLNARRGTIPFTMAAEVMEILNSDPSIRERIRYIPPRDLAATYRAYAAGQTD